MDTDKFPSANPNIEIVKLDRSANNDSDIVDDEIFDQPFDEFISGISIDEEQEARKELGIKTTINADYYAVINDYMT